MTGDELRLERESKGLSVKGLARLAGVWAMIWLWFASGWVAALGMGVAFWVTGGFVDKLLGRNNRLIDMVDAALSQAEAEAEREHAYAWCTCLGWIATLQKTAERAYWCGVHDGPDDDARQLENAASVGTEQVQVAAQDAGLVPENA